MIYARFPRRLSWITATALLASVSLPATALAGGSTPTPEPVKGSHVWFAALIALAALALLTLVLCGFKWQTVRGLLIGEDLRASTSKTQAAAWTYAICFALLVLLVGHLLYADFDAGWDDFLAKGLNSDYLWLLGIPSIGLVGAKTITQTQAASDPGAKPEKTDSNGAPATGKASLTERLAELGGHDNGRPALSDLQYLVFNVIALLYFLSAFLGHAEKGLPSLPDSLIALTGVSAGTYLATKAATRNAAATIASVRPSRVVLHTMAPANLIISGSGFRPEGVPGVPSVTLGGVDLAIAPGATDGRITATLTAQDGANALGAATSGLLDLIVYTAPGTKSAPVQIDVES